MSSPSFVPITVECIVQAPLSRVWDVLTKPEHIQKWNAASEDWHCPYAENDLRNEGRFMYRMAARDGSMAFDFAGTYTDVEPYSHYAYVMEDGRTVQIQLTPLEEGVHVKEIFDAEQQNSPELQKQGWQAILNNFKKQAETADITNRMYFEIRVQAPPELVHRKMIDAETYMQWTYVFNETSHFQGDWNTGSSILFLGIDSNGEKGGMVSRIVENIPARRVIIEHLGLVKGDTQITSGPEVEGWAGALEQYIFTPVGNACLLNISLDANEEFKSYFENTWPKALQVLKEICEK